MAPFISIIDKAIFSNASGKEPLGKSLIHGFKTLLTRPIYFIKQPSFLLIYGVYSGTYIVANVIQSLCDHWHTPWQMVSHSIQYIHLPKFIGTSITNVGLSVAKDLYFTRTFGVGPPKIVPPLSYSLYTFRDSVTIFASFNLPPIVSNGLQTHFSLSHTYSDTLAQLITPCAAQIITTPFHLLGMDVYNRPIAASSQRMSFIGKEVVKTTLARIGRIFPAYGIGGVINKKLRVWFV